MQLDALRKAHSDSPYINVVSQEQFLEGRLNDAVEDLTSSDKNSTHYAETIAGITVYTSAQSCLCSSVDLESVQNELDLLREMGLFSISTAGNPMKEKYRAWNTQNLIQ